MRYIGLDIASNKTGIAIIDSTSNVVTITTLSRVSGTFNKNKHPKQLITKIDLFFKDNDITNKDNIIVEEYNVGRTKGRHVVPWVQGYVLGYLFGKRDIDSNQLKYVNQSKWKFKLIEQHTVGKEGVEEFCYIRCKENNWKLSILSTEEDSYDAFGIAYYLYLLDN